MKAKDKKTAEKILKKAMSEKYCGETRFDFLDPEEMPLILKAMEEYHLFKQTIKKLEKKIIKEEN